MSLYAFVTGLTSLTFFITGLYVFMQSTHRLVYRRCFIFSTSVALWSFGYFITLLEANSYQLNLTASRISHAFGAFIPVAYLHFVWAILKLPERRKAFLAAYFIAAIMFLMCLTPLVVKEMLPKMGLPYYPEWGILYPFYSALFLIFPGYAQYKMAVEIKRTRGTERTRLIYFFVALALAFLGGVSLFLLVFNFHFPPHLSSLIILYPPMMAYTILVYRFLDIEVILKKTLVFTGIVTTAVLSIALPFGLLQALLGRAFGMPNPFFLMTVGIATAVLIYRPVEAFLVNATDKFLFQKKENVGVILNRLSREVVTLLESEKVSEAILETLSETLRLKSSVLFVKDEAGGFVCQKAFGVELAESYQAEDSPLISYFAKHLEILNLEHPAEKIKLPPGLNQVLEKLHAAVAIPLVFQNELIGILILGPKKSDQEFGQDEIDAFPILAGQTALAIRNARSHETILKSRIEFAQQAKLAAIGTISAGISHDIKNYINNSLGLANLFLINDDKKVYDAKPREELTALFRKLMTMISDNATRAQGVVERLSAMIKKPKEFKREQVSLEDAIEGVLDLMKGELQGHHIKLEKQFSLRLPAIMADLHALEEVFLNLLVNARHAIKGSGTITICTHQHSEEVEMSISDTGSGIPEENLKKIFDPFFTTKDTSRNAEPEAVQGTGLGLYLVREIIQQYGGRITVDSRVGKGTTFRVIFPIPRQFAEKSLAV